jgi:hypothetical protein
VCILKLKESIVLKKFNFHSIIFFLFTTVFILVGCGNKKITEDSYVSGQDYQYMYFTQGYNSHMVEVKDGYYFFSGSYLYYADKKAMKPVIMCNKPNCLHNMETDPTKVINCNAYVDGIIGADGNQFLAYYDGQLYTTSKISTKEKRESELIRLSADGTKRKSILKFSSEPISLAIHRGKIYYAQTAYDKNQKANYKISEFDLKKLNAKPQDIYIGNLEGGTIQDLLAYGNNLYFMESADNGKTSITRTIMYDILSKKTNKLFTTEDKDGGIFQTIYDNKLWYFKRTLNSDYSLREAKLYESDLKGENQKESFKIDYFCNALSDSRYLYLKDVFFERGRTEEKRSFDILDNSGKVIDSISIASLSDNHKVICGGDDHLFIENYTEDLYQIFYLDKKQFGSGKLEMKPFFEIERKRMNPQVIRTLKK